MYIILGFGIFLAAGATAPFVRTAWWSASILRSLIALAGSAIVTAVCVALWGNWGLLPFVAVAGALLASQMREAVLNYPSAPTQRISTPEA